MYLTNSTVQTTSHSDITFQIIPIVISSIALLLSVLSFWKNYLSRFKLEVTHDTPRFKLYKITSDMSGDKEGRLWWIPSFDMALSLYNTGQQTGKIRDIRILVEFTPHKTDDKIEQIGFYPHSLVKTESFQKNVTRRFEWLSDSIIAEWHPIILGGKSSKELHLVLETQGERWDEKKYGDIKLRVEVLSSESDEWKKYGNYTINHIEYYFEDKSSITPYDSERAKFRKIKKW